MRFGIGKHHEPEETAHHHVDAGDIRDAYERGRREARARHKRHPVRGVVVGRAARGGGATLIMSALHGSFAGGGASLDHGLSAAVHQGGPALKNVAEDLKGPAKPQTQTGG